MFDSWPLIGKFFVLIIPSLVMTAALLSMAVAMELYAARDNRKRERLFGASLHLSFAVLSPLAALPLRLVRNHFDIPPLFDLTALPSAMQVAITLIYVDFLRYWEHRFEHRFFWPVHAVHHSQTDLHAASCYGHPLQSLPEFLLMSIPLALIDTNASTPTLVGIIFGLQVYFIHSPLRWHFGPLRRILVDGPYHRIHHSVEERHFDKNFSIVLPIWDRLFGTAHFPSKDEWPDTGVEGIPPPQTWTGWLVMPFRQWATKARSLMILSPLGK